jgi:hypothetical protein
VVTGQRLAKRCGSNDPESRQRSEAQSRHSGDTGMASMIISPITVDGESANH